MCGSLARINRHSTRRVMSCFGIRTAGLQSPVELEQGSEIAGLLGKASEVFFRIEPLAQLATQAKLAVDKVQQQFPVGGQIGMLVQIAFDQPSLARPPALLLIGPQPLQQVIKRLVSAHYSISSSIPSSC